ncbi:MAG: helix-turn-helix transcriptional regulator [Bacillota bacterium]
MINKNKLMGYIAAAGHSQKSLAETLKISKNSLNSKINGKKQFNTLEVESICGVLNITDDREKVLIFLAGTSQNRDNMPADQTA